MKKNKYNEDEIKKFQSEFFNLKAYLETNKIKKKFESTIVTKETKAKEEVTFENLFIIINNYNNIYN